MSSLFKCLLLSKHSFSGSSRVFSHSYTSKSERTCSSCFYQGLAPWLYLGIKTLLPQCLQVNSEKTAFVYVWRTRGPLHSFWSAFCCWFPACFTRTSAHSLWPYPSVFLIQKLLPNLLKLHATGAEKSLPPHTSSKFCRHKRNSWCKMVFFLNRQRNNSNGGPKHIQTADGAGVQTETWRWHLI